MTLKDFLQRRLSEISQALSGLDEAEALIRVAESGGISQDEERRRLEQERTQLLSMKKQIETELAKAK